MIGMIQLVRICVSEKMPRFVLVVSYVEGIKEEIVLSPGHALSFIAAREEHHHVGSNNFNLFSSRSHTIFSLMVESGFHGDEYDGLIFSQLNLIDLAESESSKTETTGLRRKEGSYINKSLLTLGTVIGKFSEGKASHIPYRDSKLTRLLQSSLSGRGRVSERMAGARLMASLMASDNAVIESISGGLLEARSILLHVSFSDPSP